MDHRLCAQCKGFCCDDIGLHISPHELQNSYHRWLTWHDRNNRSEQESMAMSIGETTSVKLWNDIYIAYPMLVFTHQDLIHPDGDVHNDSKNPVYHYFCKHHNKETNNCDIYEERPMMCRTFPNNGFCGYRKVRSKRVIAFRPEWFKLGMDFQDWVDAKNGRPKILETVGEQVECKSIEPEETKQ